MIKSGKLLILFLLSCLLIYSFSVNEKKTTGKVSVDSGWVESTFSRMTLREKIGQMIISHSEGYKLEKNSKEFLRLKNSVEKNKVGGFIFFKGNSLEEAGLINDLQSLSEVPLLISADFERGTKMRLDDGSLFPSNMAIGAAGNPDLAYKMGQMIARECKALGIHQNYAPVMDVNNNPLNPIINVRSYGESPELVSQMGTMLIKGIQDENVIATAKHFPGHGDTDIDSHNDLPVLNFDMERLNKIELVPFKNAIGGGVKSVMIAHLSFPAIEENTKIPASLSSEIVSNLLIENLGFNGLIVTDALNMSGITKNFSTKEIAVMCVKAGIDLILMPENEEAAISAIEKAVNKGEISEDRINLSVKKILTAKFKLKLNENKFTDLENVSKIVNSGEEQILAQQIADESVTLVKNKDNIIPLKNKNIYVLSLNNGNDKDNSAYFEKTIKENYEQAGYNFTFDKLNGDVTGGDYTLPDNTGIVLIPIYAKVKIKTGSVGLPESQVNLINKFISDGKKVIIISFGNPYLLKNFPDVDCYICAYGEAETSINSVIKGLFGDLKFRGKLPVTITDNFKIGFSILN
jgi:beta-N-acetylhexosaminidase